MNNKHQNIRQWLLIAVFILCFLVQSLYIRTISTAQTTPITLTYSYNSEELTHVDDYMKELSLKTSISFVPATSSSDADLRWTIGNPYVSNNVNKTKTVEHQPLFFYGPKKTSGRHIFAKGQRIGVQSEDYLELNKELVFDHSEVEIYVYNQEEQMLEDYRSGQLDLYVSKENRYTVIEDNRVIAYRSYMTYALHQSAYMILEMADGNVEVNALLSQLNYGIDQINGEAMDFSLFMLNKESEVQEDFYHLLTPDEVDYLSAKSTIYAYIPETIPYFYSNGSHYYGYVYEMLSALESVLKTPIVYQSQLDEQTDLIWGNQNKASFNIRSIPFLQENFVMVGVDTEPTLTSLDLIYNQRIGSFYSNEMSNRLAAKLPGAAISYYDSVDDMVDGLYNDSIDVAMMSLWDMNYYDKAMNKKELAMRFVTPFVESSSFSLANNSQQLAQVMNKGIQVLDLEAIELKSLENVPNVLDKKRNLMLALLVIGLLICCGLLIAGIRLYVNSRRNKELRYLYAHDYLTLLPNKNGLMQHMSKRVKNNESGTVILLDVNGFKEINNRIGHKGGDDMLLAIAQKFMGIINESRVLGRVGGDEFLLILFGESPEGEREVIQKLRQYIRELQQGHPQLTHFDMSMGVVRFPDHGRDYDSLYKKAKYVIDYINQYNIEPKGLNFTQKLYDIYLSEQRLIHEIEEGIASEAFELYIQPQIHLESQSIIGGEMLIRWNHPERGLLQPGAFIDIAEKNGKMTILDYYVLDKACEFMGDMQKRGHFFKISVNMTAETFTSNDMIQRLKACVDTHGINPEYLVIEVTEDMGFENLNKANEVFDNLKQLGVKVALDDFGKGYSSLSYLEKLNIDLLKIDKYFIDNIHLREQSRHIFDVICGLAKIMKIDIIAEGVECLEQVTILKGHSDIVVQGYYYSKPITQKEFVKLYDARSISESIDFF